MARGLSPAAALVVLAAGAAAGCAADPELDPASVTEGLAAATFPDDPSVLEAVTCPEPTLNPIAQSLVCTASLHDDPITLDVAIDDEGMVTASVREPLFDLSLVESGLAARLSDDLGVEPVVRCPGLFLVRRPGVSFRCTATHDGRPLTFEGEILDATGDWTVDLVP